MRTPFFEELREKVGKLGGLWNAHLHLCRSGTLNATEELLRLQQEGSHSHLSISTKHGIIPLIHESDEYSPRRLEERVRYFLDEMAGAGTTTALTLVDVTTDRVGLSGFDVLQKLKSDYKGSLDLKIGAYSPLGFKDTEKERWALVERAAVSADFLGGLPERDDHKLYPDHIGFEESCRRVLSLSQALGKPLHIHVDQKNDPAERATERVLAVLEQLKIPTPAGEPATWLIHVISPSAYDDKEFDTLVHNLAQKNIGVICCPSAAISMRQLRFLNTPTHNSMARALEFLAAGIQVRVGSDNINDITSPAGTADLIDEMFVFCNAVRFYDLSILAKIAAGKPLDLAEREKIKLHLDADRIEIERSISFTRQ